MQLSRTRSETFSQSKFKVFYNIQKLSFNSLNSFGFGYLLLLPIFIFIFLIIYDIYEAFLAKFASIALLFAQNLSIIAFII